MPVSYELDPDRTLLVVRLAGAITEQELEEFTARLEADPAYSVGWPTLVDASEVDMGRLKASVLRQRATRPARRPAHIAIVAPADVVFGLARMFQMMSDGHGNHVEVFRDTPSAMAWLGM